MKITATKPAAEHEASDLPPLPTEAHWSNNIGVCYTEDQARAYGQACIDSRASEAAADKLDAARWRALLGSARIRMLGSAGLEQPEPNNYAHFGMEIWTIYGTSLSVEQQAHMIRGNDLGRRWLTTYADIAIKAQEKP